nr:MarR family transcriptional regulator [Marinicella sp. W31]MDC2879532.1 MarR family transcriptional regulator [Marinicella sp. W31]
MMTKKTQAHENLENEGIERISGAMTRNRLMTRRRILGRLAIARVAPALEITHLDVLDVVSRVESPGKATIGAVAEGMRIDPSRASRIVAELVTQDVLERRVCQSDARRSILVITKRAPSFSTKSMRSSGHCLKASPKAGSRRISTGFPGFMSVSSAASKITFANMPPKKSLNLSKRRRPARPAETDAALPEYAFVWP